MKIKTCGVKAVLTDNFIALIVYIKKDLKAII